MSEISFDTQAATPPVAPMHPTVLSKHGDKRVDNYYSMIQFFVLDVLLSRVVAVSTDPAPDSAFAPSFFGRPAGQLPSSHGTMSCVSRQAKIIHPFLSACASPIAWRRG